jgi:hypothetical protein
MTFRGVFGDARSSENGEVPVASATEKGIVELATNEETLEGSDETRAVTPANLAAKMASPGPVGETDPGPGTFISLKVTTGAAAGKVLVSDGEGNLSYAEAPGSEAVEVPAASATEKGIVELATPDEAVAGLDASLAVTPADLRVVVPEKAADSTLSGAPVVLSIKDVDGNVYYFKGYPTKG